MRASVILFGLSLVLASPANAQQIPYDNALAMSYCEDEWTERGVLDTRMFNYCMERQQDGYERALDLFDRYSNREPVEYIDQVVAYALDTWAKPRDYQMNMVAYEIEQQGEAYLNVAYEVNQGNVTQQQLNSCTARWIAPGEPNWNMVEYCLEN